MSIKRANQQMFFAALATSVVMLFGLSAITSAQAPGQPRLDRPAQPRADQRMQANYAPEHTRGFKASELIGVSVHSANNEEKGKVKDLMLSPDGKVEYAAVSFGGFLGIGDKLFAVPLDAIQLEWKDNKLDHGKVNITEETIKQRQGFDNDHWPTQADRGFTMNQAALPSSTR